MFKIQSTLQRSYLPSTNITPQGDRDDQLFTIVGSDYSQILELNVPPGSSVSAEPGTVLHQTSGMLPQIEADCNQGCARCIAGSSFFKLNMTNNTNMSQSIGLSALFPSRIIPLDLSKYGNQGIFIKSGAFVAAIGTDWRILLKYVGSMAAGCFGGQGFILNEIQGASWVFLGAGGTVLEKQLKQGETLLVDHTALVAFEKSVGFDIQLVQGGMLAICCGGMGLFQTKLTGPGMVLLQSMPKEKLKKSLGGMSNSSSSGSNNNNNGGNGGSGGGGGGGGGGF